MGTRKSCVCEREREIYPDKSCNPSSPPLNLVLAGGLLQPDTDRPQHLPAQPLTRCPDPAKFLWESDWPPAGPLKPLHQHPPAGEKLAYYLLSLGWGRGQNRWAGDEKKPLHACTKFCGSRNIRSRFSRVCCLHFIVASPPGRMVMPLVLAAVAPTQMHILAWLVLAAIVSVSVPPNSMGNAETEYGRLTADEDCFWDRQLIPSASLGLIPSWFLLEHID